MTTFEMLEKLADGTAAEIFRARAGPDQVLVELSRPALSEDSQLYGRFLDEARERQKLSHPGLIKRQQTGCQSDGRLFVVTEPVNGPSLSDVLKSGPIGLKETARIGVALADALSYLHTRGIFHGNLRPSNVYLTGPAEAPVPKLLDMGLLLFRTARSLKTPRSMVLVAPEYLSPERVRGQRTDALSDVYGLGILLYEMMSGQAPFIGASLEQTRQFHISKSVPWVPPGLERLAPVIGLCLAKARSDRFQSVRAVREALLHVVLEADEAMTPALPFTVPRSVHPQPSASPPSPAAKREHPRAAEKLPVLGNYELLEEIGQGGMGQVYLARHLTLDRKVAIKVLRPELAAVDVHVTRFLQEARAVNMVKHSHIVEIQDFIDDRQNGRVWCVMEYLQGPNLKQVCKKGPVPIKRAIRVARQVAQALGAAHQVGVVHRDVKPENIVLAGGDLDGDGKNDFVKVLDFGIAKLRDAEAIERPKTGLGEVIGTPAYMSPEQTQALRVGPSSDIYSLGTVLYLLLAGRLPFENNGLVQMAMSVVTRPPRRLEPVSNSGEPLPDALASIVYRCLEKSPAKRFQTMQELDTALSLFGSDGDGDEISTELDIREFESSAPKRRPSLSPPHISHRVLTPQLNRVVTQRHPRAHRALIAAGLIAALATGFAVLKLQRLWVDSQAQLAPSARPPRAPPR